MRLFALFVALVLAEIALFIQIGDWLGVLPTLALTVAGAVLGVFVMNRGGPFALSEVARSVDEMRDPARPLAHGALVMLAGMLLILPGFLTDTVGLLLLIPGLRGWLITRMGRRVEAAGAARSEAHRSGIVIIEGDYEDVTPRDGPAPGPAEETRPGGDARRGRSGWTRE